MMVILFAGLQAIPRDYVEASEVFGAGFFQRVRHVILPMLKPSIQVALLLRLIFAFEVAVVIALTGSGATVLAARRTSGRRPTRTSTWPPRTRS